MFLHLITGLVGLQCLVNSVNSATLPLSENENICRNILPKWSIRTVTNDSKSTLDGAIYFDCIPDYTEEFEIIMWNKSVWQPRDYQRLFCPGRCQKNRFVIADGYGTCSTIKCFPCDCDKPKCQIYGTCCPDVDDLSNGITDIRLNYENTSATAGCGNTSQGYDQSDNVSEMPTNVGDNVTQYCDRFNDTHSYLSVRSCPDYYTDNLIRYLCESDLPLSKRNISNYFHVTSTETHVTYFNEYCAKCNGISEFTPWNFSIKCVHSQRVYTAQNDDEFLRLSLKNDSRCTVTQIPPSGYKHYKCDSGWFNQVVSTCNVTGRWAKYDKDVVTSCAKPSLLLDRACYTDDVTHCYSNVFCAMCNMQSYPQWIHNCNMSCSQGNPTVIHLPFSLLFNFGNHNQQEDSQLFSQRNNTSSSEWTRPDGKSLSLECSPGKILLNGTCSSAINTISGLAYNISILYVPKSSHIVTENNSVLSHLEPVNDDNLWLLYFVGFTGKVKSILSAQYDYNEIELRIIFHKTVDQWRNASDKQTNLATILKPHTFMYLLKGFIIATSKQGRDEFENTMLRQLITDEFIVEINVNTSINLTPVVIHENQKYLFDDYYIQKNNLSYLEASMEPKLRMPRKLDIDEIKMDCLVMSPVLSCPFVTFTQLHYAIAVNKNVFPPTMVITVKLHAGDLELKEADELNLVSVTDTGDLRVCQHVLQSKHTYIPPVIVSGDAKLFVALETLTITCISVSLLFLVLTLLTYILLLELRNSAGENIICLCSSLFLAQASLIIASRIKKTGILCTAFGISIHYLWLKVFCWCFTCSYNMFRVFTSKTRSTRSSVPPKKDLLMKLFLCSAAPAVVVSTVIVANILSSDRKSTGYGKKHCSLDIPLLVFITLLTPILGILLSNFLFYIISVIKIHNIRKLQTLEYVSKQESIRSIYIYLKLSTVTGTFWILTVISEAIDIDSLRVIAILLNGLQGVFIFVSFVCNKRVFKICKHHLGF